MHGVQDALQIGVRVPAVAHVHLAVRVEDLVAEGADGEVGPLGEEHDPAGAAGAGDEPAVGGPEAGEEARDSGFAGAVGAGDEGVGAGGEGEV